MKNIAHVLSTGGYSGAEKIAIEICDLLKNKHNFTYICKSGEIEDYLKKKNIKYLLYKSPKDLIKLLRKNNGFDIVHAHDYAASVICGLFSKGKVISHIHANAPFACSLNIKSILFYISSHRIDSILCVSKSIIDEMYFKEKLKNKLKLTYNWVNIEERYWNESVEKNIDILFVGRIKEEKDPMFFLEIIRILVYEKKMKDIKVYMAGSGPLDYEVRTYIKQNALEKNIKLIGFTNVPHKYMKKSKVFFVPSRWEGFGLVFLEALVNECAVIAPPVGGIKEIFKDNLENMAIDKNDIINKISLLIENNIYREEYVEQSKHIIERFDMKTNIEKINEYYNIINN